MRLRDIYDRIEQISEYPSILNKTNCMIGNQIR